MSAGETKGKKIIGIQRQKIWNRKGQGSTDACCSLALILKRDGTWTQDTLTLVIGMSYGEPAQHASELRMYLPGCKKIRWMFTVGTIVVSRLSVVHPRVNIVANSKEQMFTELNFLLPKKW